jgi:exodeoxyribonuclease VII large subunit
MKAGSYTLKELYSLISDTIEGTFDGSYWIRAEIAKFTENYSGHCYLELVEKSETKDTIVAQGKAMIWSNVYRVLKAFFKTTTNRELSEGMKILFKARIEFHEVYGLNLHITDIDPSYTVGDLALKKNIIIKRLREEGIFDMNRETIMPLVPQRLAVISSETAAGYNDFVTHLAENQEGYRFEIKFFPAIMQGEKAETSIISALEKIFDKINHYDVVAIIRGGGSQTDLSCFDSYGLACHVAQFPIPVITGIGHEQDDSVVDMVAHTRLKTPTAVAEFLISMFELFDQKLDENLQWVVETCEDIIARQNEKMSNYVNQLPIIIQSIIHNNQNLISNYLMLLNTNLERTINSSQQLLFAQDMKTQNAISKIFLRQEMKLEAITKNSLTAATTFAQQHRKRLEHYKNIADIANPVNTLNRGFSITKINGKVVNSIDLLNIDEEIETILIDGRIKSKITKKSNAPLT